MSCKASKTEVKQYKKDISLKNKLAKFRATAAKAKAKPTAVWRSEKERLAALKLQERLLSDPKSAEGKSVETSLHSDVRARRNKKRKARLQFVIRMKEALPPQYTNRSQIPHILDTSTDTGFTVEQRLSIYSRKNKCSHGRAFNQYKMYGRYIQPQCDHASETIITEHTGVKCRNCAGFTFKTIRNCGHDGYLCNHCMRTYYPCRNNSEISCGCRNLPKKYIDERSELQKYFDSCLKQYNPPQSREEFATELKQAGGMTYSRLFKKGTTREEYDLEQMLDNLTLAHPEGGVTSMLSSVASSGTGIVSAGVQKISEVLTTLKQWFKANVTEAFASRFPTFGKFWFLLIELLESLIATLGLYSPIDYAMLYCCLKGDKKSKCVAISKLLLSVIYDFCDRMEVADDTYGAYAQRIISLVIAPVKVIAHHWKKSLMKQSKEAHPQGYLDVIHSFIYALPSYLHRGMLKTVTTFIKDILPLLSALKLTTDLVPKISTWFKKLFGFWVDNDNDWLLCEMKNEESPIHHAITACMTYRLAALSDDTKAQEIFVDAACKIKAASKFILDEKRQGSATSRFLADCDKMLSMQMPPASREHEPFCVRIYGPAGVGKSRNLPILFGGLVGAKSKEEFDQATFARGASDYWDGVGKRPIILYDEFGANIDSETDLKDLLLLVSASPFMPNFANIVSATPKGVSIDPKIIICCSNIKNDDSKQLLCKEALRRRFHLAFESRLLDGRTEFRLDHGALTKEFSDVVPGDWMSLAETRSFIYDMYARFLESRKVGLIVNDESMADFDRPPLVVKSEAGSWSTVRKVTPKSKQLLDAVSIKRDIYGLTTVHERKEIEKAKNQSLIDFEAAHAESLWNITDIGRRLLEFEVATFGGFVLFANLYSSFHFLADLRDHTLSWWTKLRCMAVPALTGFLLYVSTHFFNDCNPESGHGRGKPPHAAVRVEGGGEVPPTQQHLQNAFVKLAKFDGTNAVNGVLVGGTYLLTVEHAFLDYRKNAGYSDEGTVYNVWRKGVAEPTTFNFDSKQIRKVFREKDGVRIEIDLVLYRLPANKFAQSRNLVHRFWSGDVALNSEDCLVLDHMPDKTQIWRETRVTSLKQVHYTVAGKTYKQVVAQGTYDSQPGTCGAPILMASAVNSPIIGIHIARNEDWTAPLLLLVTREMLERAAPELRKGMDPPPLENHHLNAEVGRPESLVVGEILQSIGKITPPVFQSTRTQIQPSVLHDLVVPHVSEPSILSNKDPRLPPELIGQCDMIKNGIKKISKPGTIPDEHRKPVVEDMIDYYNSLPLPDTFDEITPLCLDTALNGSRFMYGCSYLKSIDMTTSPGFPFVQDGKKKVDLFQRIDNNIEPTDAFLEQLYVDLCHIKEKRRPDWIFLSALKDERRPIEKVRKSPKTRMFTVCPVVLNILAKQLYGRFMCKLMHNSKKVYYAGGIDRLGVSWHYMISRLSETSNLGFATDISCHDGRFSPEILGECHEIMCGDMDLSVPYRISVDSDWSERINRLEVSWMNIGEAIDLTIRYPIYAVGDELIQAVGTLASGLWSTQLVGSLGTEMYLRCAWNDVVPKNMWGGFYFQKYTDHAIMGDDNMNVVVKGAAKYFNGRTFCEYTARYGIDCTAADKNGQPVEVEKLEDLNFLKNTTGYLAGFYCPIMERGAALEQMNWIRKCKFLSKEELTEINVNNALRAIFFHGQEEFTNIRNAVLALRPDFKLLTYNVLYVQYVSYGHFPGYQGEEPTFGDYMNEPDDFGIVIPVGDMYEKAFDDDHANQLKNFTTEVCETAKKDTDLMHEILELSDRLNLPIGSVEDELGTPEMDDSIKCLFCPMTFGTRNRFLDHITQHQDQISWKTHSNIHDMMCHAPLSQLKIWYREMQEDITMSCEATKTDFVKLVRTSGYEAKSVYSALNSMINNAGKEYSTNTRNGQKKNPGNQTPMDIAKLLVGKTQTVPGLILQPRVEARDVYELLSESLDSEAHPESGIDPNAGKSSAMHVETTVSPTPNVMNTTTALADPTDEKQNATNQEGFTLASKGTSDNVTVKTGVISVTTNTRAELSLNDQAWSLSQMLQKWQQVAVVDWPTTSAAGDELFSADVIGDLITSNFTGAPFQAFDEFRCTNVRLKVVVVGSKFHQGRAVLGFFPRMIPLSTGNPFGITRKKLIEIGALQLDASQGEEQQYIIPFRHPKGFLNLLQHDSLGSLHLIVHSPLKAAAGASTSVSIRIFFCLDNPEFKIPRAIAATFKQMTQAQNILGKSHGKIRSSRMFAAHPESGNIPQCKINQMPREGAYIAPVRAMTGDPAVPHFGEHDENLLDWGKRYVRVYKDSGVIQAPTVSEKFWHLSIANLMIYFWQLRMMALYRGAINLKVVMNILRDATSERPRCRLRAYLDSDREQNNKAENVYNGLYEQPFAEGDVDEVLEFQIPQLSINGAVMNAWTYINQTSQAIGELIDKRTLTLAIDHYAFNTALRYNLAIYASLSDEFGAGVFLGTPRIRVNQTLPGFWGPDHRDHDFEEAHPEMLSSVASAALDKVKEKIVPENVIGSVLETFLDKPAISEQPVWTIPKRHGFMNFATGPEQIDKLVLHPAHQQLCDQEHFGTNNNDLSLKTLFTRPSYIGSFQWKATDVIGDLLATNYVGPLFDAPAGSTDFELSLMSYISSKFAYWRGGITLVFDVVTSMYHEGRLDITYHPNINEVPATYDARVSQYAMSVMIKNTENCFAITFPYLGEVPWKNVFDGRALNAPDSTLPSPSFSSYFSGIMAVSVGAPLRVPNNVAQEVEVMMYVLPAEDFQLAHRTTKNFSLTEDYLG